MIYLTISYDHDLFNKTVILGKDLCCLSDNALNFHMYLFLHSKRRDLLLV